MSRQNSREADRPVALVTGSGPPRLGNAVVRALSERGYSVAIHAHRSVDQAERTRDELRAAGGEAICVTADVADEEEVRSMVAAVKDTLKRLDVLVNCAAIWEAKALEETSAVDVHRQFGINTLGTFLCCQHAGLLMCQQPTGGAIINFGDWALDHPYLDHAAYFASKGSIPTLTRAFALELATRNPHVRVNAILPGRAMVPEGLSDSERQHAIHGTLLKRAGSPADIVNATMFLIEHEFLTGVCLPVDGGRGLICGQS